MAGREDFVFSSILIFLKISMFSYPRYDITGLISILSNLSCSLSIGLPAGFLILNQNIEEIS